MLLTSIPNHPARGKRLLPPVLLLGAEVWLCPQLHGVSLLLLALTALQLDFSDLDTSPFFADSLLIEAAKNGNFGKVSVPAAHCLEQQRLALGSLPEGCIGGMPLGLWESQPSKLHSCPGAAPVNGLPPGVVAETSQPLGKKLWFSPGGHRGKGLGSVAELDRTPCQTPNIHIICWTSHGCDARAWVWDRQLILSNLAIL